MGADLYVSSIYNANRDKYYPAFEASCHLRDTRRDARHRQAKADCYNEDMIVLHQAVKDNIELGDDFIIALMDGCGASDAAQKLVTYFWKRVNDVGYFRDSYNPGSVFWRLGLSWWDDVGKLIKQDKDDIAPKDDENNLSVKSCSLLREMVETAYLTPMTVEELLAEKDTWCDRLSDDDPEVNVKEWNEYWEKRREALLQFLDLAIENGGMYASI